MHALLDVHVCVYFGTLKCGLCIVMSTHIGSSSMASFTATTSSVYSTFNCSTVCTFITSHYIATDYTCKAIFFDNISV